VKRAFDFIRAAPEIDLEVPPNVHRVKRAQLATEEIVLEDHLASPALPHGIRFLRGVDVICLAALAPRFRQVPDLFEAYNRQTAQAPYPDLLGALSVMVAKGLLGPRTPGTPD